MKYAALQAAKLLLLAVLAVLLWGTLHADPQQADFSVLREQAEQAMDTTGMRQADAQLLRRLYGLNENVFRSYLMNENIFVISLGIFKSRRDYQKYGQKLKN